MLSSGFTNIIFRNACHCSVKWLNFLVPSVPVKYIRLHLTLLLLPVIVGVIGLITINGREVIGIFALDKNLVSRCLCISFRFYYSEIFCTLLIRRS